MIEQVYLKILKESDVTHRYVSWFSDPRVVRFSDGQYRNSTLEAQKDYVQSCVEDPSVMLWGIFLQNLHIGNIVLDNIDFNHSKSEVTYLLGDPEYWGKGIASYAVQHVINYADRVLELHKLFAGVAEPNVGSIKVLQKCGFTVEAKRDSHLFYNGTRMAQIDYKLILR